MLDCFRAGQAMVVTFPNSPYELYQPFLPAGDQPEAIASRFALAIRDRHECW